MDQTGNDIKRELEKLSGRFGPAAVFPATVKSINSDDTVAVELASGLEIDDCRLKSVVKEGSKIILEPTVGSTVLIASIESSHEYVVVSVEEISRLYVKIGTVEFEVSDKFQMKKGTDTLKAIITDTIDEINKIVVLMGTSPNVAALTAIKTRTQQLFQ